MHLDCFKTFLVYIHKESDRIVRLVEHPQLNSIPTGLKNYDVRYVTSYIDENSDNLLKSPTKFIFNIIHGLMYSPDSNFDYSENQNINLKLQAVEILWQIAGSCIKNTEMQYFYNDKVREVLQYELMHGKNHDIDSLSVFINQNFLNLDIQSYQVLMKIKEDYTFQKTKDIIKSILVSQDKIMDSDDPTKTLFIELRENYIKY